MTERPTGYTSIPDAGPLPKVPKGPAPGMRTPPRVDGPAPFPPPAVGDPRPSEPSAATLDVRETGLDPDQEIRARALEAAADTIARIPSHAGYEPLSLAGQYAEWIRSGWPRMDGNDGCPHHLPTTDDGSTR